MGAGKTRDLMSTAALPRTTAAIFGETIGYIAKEFARKKACGVSIVMTVITKKAIATPNTPCLNNARLPIGNFRALQGIGQLSVKLPPARTQSPPHFMLQNYYSLVWPVSPSSRRSLSLGAWLPSKHLTAWILLLLITI